MADIRSESTQVDQRAQRSPRAKHIIRGSIGAAALVGMSVLMTNWNNPAIGNCAGVTNGRIEFLGSYGLTDDMCDRAYDVYHDGVGSNDDKVGDIGREPFGVVDETLWVTGLLAGAATFAYAVKTDEKRES